MPAAKTKNTAPKKAATKAAAKKAATPKRTAAKKAATPKAPASRKPAAKTPRAKAANKTAKATKAAAPKRGRKKATKVAEVAEVAEEVAVDPFAEATPVEAAPDAPALVLPTAKEIQRVKARRKVTRAEAQADLVVIADNFAQLDRILQGAHLPSRERTVLRRICKYGLSNLDTAGKNVANVHIPRKKNASGKPSGLNLQYHVTQELADFMGLDEGQTASRAEACRAFCAYVKDNNLQNPDAKREIVPDKTILNILDYDPASDPPLTYSSYVKYFQDHFVQRAD